MTADPAALDPRPTIRRVCADLVAGVPMGEVEDEETWVVVGLVLADGMEMESDG